MLDAAFQAGTDTVLNDMAQRPRAPRVQAPRFSLWGTVDATARGFAAGINEVVGSAADVMGAFGEITAGSYTDMLGGMPDRQERQRQIDAALKMQREGPDFMSPVGGAFRSVAEGYMPDATTSHAAEVVVADFFRVATKAVGAAVTLGPLAGAAVAGAEEGFTQSDALARQGVDLATRSKVGAVTGVVTAAGLALPVAGRTWAQTVGLAVAGGPASFVGQNAANRAILEAADYSKQAQQFDPFNPVGLALSTILPLGFGAMAMRGARARPADAPVIPQEVEDAARAGLLRENVEAHRLTPALDMAAAAEHQAGVSRALEQMAAGQRVDVAEAVPVALQDAQSLDGFNARIDQARTALAAEVEAAALARAEPAPAQRIEPEAAPRDPLVAAVEDATGQPMDAVLQAPGIRALRALAGVEDAAPAPPARAGATATQDLVMAGLERAVADLETARGDLPVQLDGMDAPVPLRELMATMREEMQADLADVPLLEAAATCFIRTGAAAA